MENPTLYLVFFKTNYFSTKFSINHKILVVTPIEE